MQADRDDQLVCKLDKTISMSSLRAKDVNGFVGEHLTKITKLVSDLTKGVNENWSESWEESYGSKSRSQQQAAAASSCRELQKSMKSLNDIIRRKSMEDKKKSIEASSKPAVSQQQFRFDAPYILDRDPVLFKDEPIDYFTDFEQEEPIADMHSTSTGTSRPLDIMNTFYPDEMHTERIDEMESLVWNMNGLDRVNRGLIDSNNFNIAGTHNGATADVKMASGLINSNNFNETHNGDGETAGDSMMSHRINDLAVQVRRKEPSRITRAKTLNCLICSERDFTINTFIFHLSKVHNLTPVTANIAFKCVCGFVATNTFSARRHENNAMSHQTIFSVIDRPVIIDKSRLNDESIEPASGLINSNNFDETHSGDGETAEDTKMADSVNELAEQVRRKEPNRFKYAKSLNCPICSERDFTISSFPVHLSKVHNTTPVTANLAFKCVCGFVATNAQNARHHKDYAVRHESIFSVIDRPAIVDNSGIPNESLMDSPRCTTSVKETSLHCILCQEKDMSLDSLATHLKDAHNTTAPRAKMAFKCVCGFIATNVGQTRFHKYSCRRCIFSVARRPSRQTKARPQAKRAKVMDTEVENIEKKSSISDHKIDDDRFRDDSIDYGFNFDEEPIEDPRISRWIPF